MGKLITKFILALTIFFAGLLSVNAAPVIKITGLEFDNSDNIVVVKSIGKIYPKTMETPEDNDKSDRSPQNVITRGHLSNPDRIFVDISNAILTDGARTYVMKNSCIDTVKMSQFSTNPHVVRIVFTYNKKFDQKNFSVFANDRQIILRYSKNLVGSEKFKTIYNNMTKGEHRADVFESSSYSIEKRAPVQNVSDSSDSILEPKDTTLKSYFYLDDVELAKNGIMVKGNGFLSLKSSFSLENPSRLVVDIENANVAQTLRNKSFTIPDSNALVVNGVVMPRELLRIGQNDSNIARLVIQGDNAKDYRLVISPDMQGLFIAKRSDVLNSKLTQTTSAILSFSAKNAGEHLDVVNIAFSNPVTLTMFEENSKFYVDLQNVSDFNEEALKTLNQNPDFKDISAQKIALEKSRIIFPLKDSTAINAQISPEGKELRIYFKQRVKPAPAPKVEPIVVVKPPKDESEDKIKERPSTIKQMYRVVIDPGHGGADVGATRDGIYEKDITLAVSKIVESNLSKQGVYTHMTRDRDKTVELSERSDFSNAISPDVFVSIHVNSSARDDIIGLETHWFKDDSIDYAKKVHAKFASAKNLSKWETKDRGLFKSKFYVINHTDAPAILVEIGFISNPYERKLLMSQKRQEEIAKSITDGIMEYLKSRK